MGTRVNEELRAQLRSPAEIAAAGRRSRMSNYRPAPKAREPEGERGYLNLMGLMLRTVANPTLLAFLRSLGREHAPMGRRK